jgi:hypothetical protein
VVDTEVDDLRRTDLDADAEIVLASGGIAPAIPRATRRHDADRRPAYL